ncbi:hypothetical protein SY83_21275 [Paenibacillus swuensis]|uniref:DUF3898 domain-containing protein n=1 Tax=Paenibacillus swuensis TaxID=1178515 RepID=A0A172TMY4_9BACL|nr:DUF3900 domain-containing protein [Paenibacillus swuensis]ANE48390.1 hypothetical protein SY83_21275 [Paenibacillus swuensis]
MNYSVQYLSFFVVQPDSADASATKGYKHYRTLDEEAYLSSELKHFLDGEFARISKRKVDKNPESENAPTKIGRFIVEPGHELDSNPNYNLFQRLRHAGDEEEFMAQCDDMLRVYMDTSAVRGGALIIASAKLNEYFNEPFIFVLKCDFEPKVVRVADERSLIAQVDMAITARNMKSIQYPFMIEEGMIDDYELKIHQASHARYFEDFLKYVSYEKSMPEIMNEQVVSMVKQYMDEKWQHAQQPVTPDGMDASSEESFAGGYPEERQKEEHSYEVWAASDKRELQEKWEHEQVVEAAAQLTVHKEDLELKFKLDHIAVKGLLSDYGNKVHIAEENGRYIVILEGDLFQFDKGVSPVELLKPDTLNQVIERIREKPPEDEEI